MKFPDCPKCGTARDSITCKVIYEGAPQIGLVAISTERLWVKCHTCGFGERFPCKDATDKDGKP